MSVSAHDRFAFVLVLVAVVAFGLSVWWGTQTPKPLMTISCPVYEPPATQIPEAREQCK